MFSPDQFLPVADRAHAIRGGVPREILVLKVVVLSHVERVPGGRHRPASRTGIIGGAGAKLRGGRIGHRGRAPR